MRQQIACLLQLNEELARDKRDGRAVEEGESKDGQMQSPYLKILDPSTLPAQKNDESHHQGYA